LEGMSYNTVFLWHDHLPPKEKFSDGKTVYCSIE
jgi:hypothetical protein